ncbi:MAG TPA: hypothetical protein VHR45_09090 [Thermoanaerobaculia bacterium]|nr:hypothetical protein [Thermoanaerobaculia bacterium]
MAKKQSETKKQTVLRLGGSRLLRVGARAPQATPLGESTEVAAGKA